MHMMKDASIHPIDPRLPNRHPLAACNYIVPLVHGMRRGSSSSTIGRRSSLLLHILQLLFQKWLVCFSLIASNPIELNTYILPTIKFVCLLLNFPYIIQKSQFQKGQCCFNQQRNLCAWSYQSFFCGDRLVRFLCVEDKQVQRWLCEPITAKLRQLLMLEFITQFVSWYSISFSLFFCCSLSSYIRGCNSYRRI